MTRAIRAKLIFYVLIGILVAAFVGLTAWVLVDKEQANTELTERVEQKNAIISNKDDAISGLTDDLVASQANATRLYDQLLALGATPEGQDPQNVPVEGEPGSNGRDGRDATDAQIFAQVVQFCAIYACIPPPQPPPTNGTDGRNGQDGKDGQNGTNGLDGAPGRGIQSLYCDDTTGRWTVTYTDGVTADAGACTTPPLEGVLP